MLSYRQHDAAAGGHGNDTKQGQENPDGNRLPQLCSGHVGHALLVPVGHSPRCTSDTMRAQPGLCVQLNDLAVGVSA